MGFDFFVLVWFSPLQGICFIEHFKKIYLLIFKIVPSFLC